jgi:Cd2+/Zn2+-exporting ATPase
MTATPIIHAQYDVDGMDCAECALHIERELRQLSGITQVQVNFVTGKMQLSSRQPIPEQSIRQAVNRAGYTLKIPSAQRSTLVISAWDDNKTILPILLAGLFILAGMSAVYILSAPLLGISLYLLGIVSGGVYNCQPGDQGSRPVQTGYEFSDDGGCYRSHDH